MHIRGSYKSLPWSKYYGQTRGFSHLAQQLQRFSPDDAEERCGLLIGVPHTIDPTVMREVPNAHPIPGLHFRILTSDVERVTALIGPRRSVVGVIHTHPGRDRDGWYPSADDLVRASAMPDKMHAVYHPYTRRFTTYNRRGIRMTLHIR